MYRQGLFRLWRGLTLVTRAASVRTAVTFNRCPSTDLKLNPTRSWIVLTSSRAMAGTQGEGSSSEGTHSNRLALEKSPYLLQHASNPVDWFPWGKEAFRKAKDEDKPIFLSVGYSTCHWCHVMERESFENEDIGKLMNDYFVNIKVDREERPDVDNVYMNFVRATTGGGGWPMSVWLTPDLKPIVGGTYFPPDDRYYDRPGFKSIIINIALKWRNEREKMDEQGTVVVDALLRAATRQPADTSQVEFLPCVQRCFSMLRANYDEDHGGIGTSPKFPQPVNLNFLLKKYAEDPSGLENKVALKMVTDTLLFMAKGGIHDHIANGFHRYSTDRQWHVPHFEKMLYDQAQLAALYAETYQVTKENVFAEVARDILKYVSRDLTDPNGGFYSAEDADSLPTPEASTKKEGAFCVWTCEQLEALLSEPLADHQHLTQADIFKHHYGIKTLGNVDPYQDPHEELKGQNVLIVRAGVAETADKFCLTLEETESVLEKCRKILFDVRKTRPPPHLDNKMLTSWNGLMISGFAKAGQILDDQDYVDRATKAAHFLKTHMYNEETNTLLRSSYAGENDAVAQSPTPIEGFADDYAFLIRGLVDLYEAGLDESWLAWAEQLQEQQDALFWDAEGGAYFSSREDDKSIIIRMKEDHDGAEPCANSVSASNLVRLSYLLERPEWRHRAVDLLAAFAETLEKAPAALPEMVGAHMLLQAAPKQIVIAGDHGAEDTRALLRCVHSYYLPHKVLLLANGQEGGFLHSRLSLLPSLQRLEGRATAYVCENYSCSLPVNTVQALEEQLRSEQRESN